jgi:hypothetical protein
MSTIQKNERKGQNRFCLEVMGVVGRRGMVLGVGGRNGSNNVCTYE